MTRAKSKNAFTLLEIMACLVIITIAGAAIGIGGGHLFRYHQFKGAAQSFVFDLNKWRVMAIAFNCDVACSTEKDQEGYKVTWSPDAPIEKPGTRLTYPLKGVKEILVQGKKKGPFEFTLFSSGMISSSQVLTLSPGKEKKAVSIDLSYPADLKEGSFKPSFKSALSKSSTLPYPKKKDEG